MKGKSKPMMGGSSGNKSVMGNYPHKSSLGMKGKSMVGGKSGPSSLHSSGNKNRKKMCT